MPPGFASLGDKRVNSPIERLTGLSFAADHGEHEYASVFELLHERTIAPECHHCDINSRFNAHLDVVAAHEGH